MTTGSTFPRIGAAAVALAAALAVAYLCWWPVPAKPVAWQAPKPPGYTGPHAPNGRLAKLNRIDVGSEFGPEHIVFGPDGMLYVAMTSGNVLRMDRDGGRREVLASTGGRVLGLAFDGRGRLVAADAMKGLLAIGLDGSNGGVQLLTDRMAPDDPIRYANSVVVAPDGIIYFTDASGRFAPSHWGGTYEASVLDILEQAATGRVLAFDPVTQATRVVAQGLSFANGIALTADGRSLVVSETGRYRIWKVDAMARGVDVRRASSQARVLIDNLPGYPDNVMRGRDGRIWVASSSRAMPQPTAWRSGPFCGRCCCVCRDRGCRSGSAMAMSLRSTRTGVSSRTFKTPPARTLKPPVPPRRRTASTSTASTRRPSAGWVGDVGLIPHAGSVTHRSQQVAGARSTYPQNRADNKGRRDRVQV